LENCVNEAKSQYQDSLRNLEKISNEIHAQRKKGKIRRELGERTAGVGEEQIDYTELVYNLVYVHLINFFLRNNYHQHQFKQVHQHHLKFHH
jgi:hypothetical protein